MKYQLSNRKVVWSTAVNAHLRARGETGFAIQAGDDVLKAYDARFTTPEKEAAEQKAKDDTAAREAAGC